MHNSIITAIKHHIPIIIMSYSMVISTPWGPSHRITTVGDQGILKVTTAEHGGYFVPPEIYQQMPEELRCNTFGGGTWFDEDVEWALVALAFPHLFLSAEHLERQTLRHAINTMKAYLPTKCDDGMYLEAALWTQRNEPGLAQLYNSAIAQYGLNVPYLAV